MSENRRMNMINRKVVMALLAVLMFPLAANALPLSEIITCRGCALAQAGIDDFSAYVATGAVIELVGPSGYQSYIWTGGGQAVYAQNIKAKITGDIAYVLKITDGTSVKSKTVQIKLTSSSQNIGVPELSEIELDNGLWRIALAVGDRFRTKADWSNANNYANISFYWEVEPESGLLIENKNSKETWIKVLKMPEAGKNPTIKAIITNGNSRNEKNVMVRIVSNTAPTVRSNYDTPLSNKPFEVRCSLSKCFTGKEYNDDGDFFAEFSVSLIEAGGTIIGPVVKTFNRNSAQDLTVSIPAGSEGKKTLRVTGKDSHGLSSIFEEPILVGFGNTAEDAPYIKLVEPVECIGMECVFNTDKTEDHDIGLFRKFEIKTASGFEKLFDKGGHLCTAPVCRTVFRETGKKEIKITMQYIRNMKPSGRVSEKTVIVCPGCGSAPQVSVTVSRTAGNNNVKQQAAITRATTVAEEEYKEEYNGVKPMPFLETSFVAALLLIATMAAKRNKKI